MKKVFRLMMMAMMAVATMGFVACEKDNDNSNSGNGQQGGDPTPEMPSYATLERTEWEGVFSTYDQTPGYTQNYLNIHWTIDFLSDGQGEIMFYLESPGYDPDTYTFPMTYTYDGVNSGTISNWEYGTAGNFTVDPYNRALVIENLTLEIGETEDAGYTYGGVTTLHQVR